MFKIIDINCIFNLRFIKFLMFIKVLNCYGRVVINRLLIYFCNGVFIYNVVDLIYINNISEYVNFLMIIML